MLNFAPAAKFRGRFVGSTAILEDGQRIPLGASLIARMRRYVNSSSSANASGSGVASSDASSSARRAVRSPRCTVIAT